MSLVTTVDPPLVGRESQLAQLDLALGEARASRGSAVVLLGEPGAGKTALASAALAGATDLQVLRCRGVESEAELPFSGLHEMLRPVLPAANDLAPEERGALMSALAMTGPAQASPVSVSMAVLSLITQATRTQPVVLLVDDLHWVDAETTSVLGFIARRIAHDSVLVLATSRPAGVVTPAGATRIVLGPLSTREVAELAVAHGCRALTGATAAALASATGGNPLAVLETIRMLGDDVDLLGSTLDEPPPPSELIARGYESRFADLSEAGRRAVAVVATAVGEPSGTLAAVLTTLGLDASALDEAESAGIIRRDPGVVTFAHPVFRSLAYHGCSGQERRRFHAALAAEAADRGSRAWHAASACETLDERIAAELEDAATDFLTRGGHLAAARALERAARLTPNSEARAQRTFAASEAARWAGRHRMATELSERALGLAKEPGLRLRVERQLMALAIGYNDAAVQHAWAMRIAEAAEGVDPAVHVDCLLVAALEGSISGRMEDCRAAIGRLRQADIPRHLLPTAELCEGIVVLLNGDDPHLGAERVVAAARRPSSAESRSQLEEVGEVLVWIEEYDLAADLTSRAIASSRETGLLHTLSGALWLDGHRRFRTGEWHAAEAALEQARELSTAIGRKWLVGMVDASIALLRAARGDESVRESIAVNEITAREAGHANILPYLSTALGLLDLAAGRGAGAVVHLERARDWCEQAGQREPGMLSWPADLVEAYEIAGEHALALQALEQLRERAEATGRVWALGSVARLEGLLVPGDGYVEAFETAIAHFTELRSPFELARTQLGFGRRLRRAGERGRSRVQLRAAGHTFEQLGATSWAEQVRTELAATGEQLDRTADPVQDVQLTPQEICVADCVAQGLTNRQAAAQLYLTTKTIEWHLRSIYRKLGIRSRLQLAQWMANTAVGLSASTF